MTAQHDPAIMLDAAYGYIDRCGPWPLFPADARTKRPLISTGRDHAEHASIELGTIHAWFGQRFRGAAIGMPTGAPSGVVVIDADRKHDGEALLAELELALGPLPRTRTVRTQSGGLHVYLAHPGNGIRVRTGAGKASPLGRLLGDVAGVDVRADGGIVILPPSCGYSWIADDDEPLPPIPRMWLAAIQGAGDPPPPPPPSSRPVRRASTGRWSDPERGPAICDGGRNTALFRRGVALRHEGATNAEIEDDLLRVNAVRCKPPLAEREARRIAASAARAGRRP